MTARDSSPKRVLRIHRISDDTLEDIYVTDSMELWTLIHNPDIDLIAIAWDQNANIAKDLVLKGQVP